MFQPVYTQKVNPFNTITTNSHKSIHTCFPPYFSSILDVMVELAFRHTPFQGPKSSGATTLLCADGSTLLTDKEKGAGRQRSGKGATTPKTRGGKNQINNQALVPDSWLQLKTFSKRRRWRSEATGRCINHPEC